jgi:3-hydroxybutyryl-CoA dehydratase
VSEQNHTPTARKHSQSKHSQKAGKVEPLTVGQKYVTKFEITPQMVQDFANVSGDFNPIHLDAEFASQTPFKKPIAHGLLTAALMSGIMGVTFPGPGTILIENSMKFVRPVFVGDTITFEILVEERRADKPICVLLCRVLNSAGQVTSEGRTVVKAPR